MKYFLLALFYECIWGINCSPFQSTLGHIKAQKSAETQENSVIILIHRIIPDRAEEFDVKIDPNLAVEGIDKFKIEKLSNGTIQITGSTGVAAATAFNYYLKYYCNCHISWEGSQLNLPKSLPEINITITFNDRFRYYQNVCTTSYSFVWWNLDEWQKHIDWMVLNGFNLVLAFNGQEAIWERVYKKFNLTQSDIDEHFAGPAFLAWQRMGNIRGWGGPLSKAWHQKSLIYQKQILEKLRNFGVIPVLPAFAGHLPRAFKKLYPDVNITEMGAWNGFNSTYCCAYFLEPTENLFNNIGKLFIEEQIKEYGTDHIYNCDSFNENTPAYNDLTYLANVGKSIYNAMTAADPKAIWLMQNWLFVHDFLYWTNTKAKALLTSVPTGKMIVLDLQSEQFPQYVRLNQYFGQPFIWCMLHNFGGTLGMWGSSSIINEEPIRARQNVNGTMIGTGLTPEGINQNYVIYDLMTETAWRNKPANLSEWFENYAIRRYGYDDKNANQAWQILSKSIYNYSGLERQHGQYAITRTPSLTISTWIWYELSELLEAWNQLLKASINLNNSETYLHDLVDVTRQVLQVLGDVYYNQLVEAFNIKDVSSFENKAMIFLDILHDLEKILASNKDFLLGVWLQSAKDAANTTDDEILFEYNARNQITLWGPNGEIMNYAIKQWSGIVSHFLAPRWSLFITYANDSLLGNNKFNENVIKEKMFKEVEEPFTFDQTKFPVEPEGDTVEIARNIHDKWRLNFDVVLSELQGDEKSIENEYPYYTFHYNYKKKLTSYRNSIRKNVPQIISV